MKAFFKSVLATVVGAFIGLILAFILVPMFLILIFRGAQSGPSYVVENKSILHLKLDGQLVDKHRPLDFAVFGERSIFTEDRTIGLWELTKALEAAKNDKRVSGVYLDFRDFDAGWAGVAALRRYVEDFGKSGKWVYAYADRLDEKTYYLATAANEIYLQPNGEIEFNGLAINEAFLKGLFEKLELQPKVFRAGKFKAAIEPLILEKMSDENRKQSQDLIDDLWSEVRATVSKSRKLESEKVDELASTLAVMSAEDAKKNGLITDVAFVDDVEDKMAGATVGQDNELLLMTTHQYLRDKSVMPIKTGKKIAVLFAEGEIVSGDGGLNNIGADTLREDIKDAAQDEDVAAIVLRVNSPGGDALASDVIWRELAITDEDTPVIVSMGDLAASGGYYIASAGRYIYAEPTTLTGSIGVFGVMFNTERFFRSKAGVSFDRVVTHPYADLGDPNRPMSEFEEQKVQGEVNRVYKRFLDVVEEGRGFEKRTDLENIAEGRVWSGMRAKQIGLVDEIGGLEKAIEKAADYAKLGKNYQVEVYPKDFNSFTRLIEKFSGDVYEGSIRQVLGEFGLARVKDVAKKIGNFKSGIYARMPSDLEIK